MFDYYKNKILLIGSGYLLVIILVISILFSVITIIGGVNEGSSYVKEFPAPFKNNISYVVSSEFGFRIDPFTGKRAFHRGIDLVADKGSEIVAVYDGTVRKVDYEEDGYGNYVMLEHNVNEKIIHTIYAHLLDESTLVSEGQAINQGTVLAIIGSTGKSTGTHLHFEVSLKNASEEGHELIDPSIIIYNDLGKNE